MAIGTNAGGFDRKRWAPALWLLGVNAAMFVLLHIVAACLRFMADEQTVAPLLQQLMLSADASSLISRPWTIVSFMFTQYDLWHLFINLLWLQLATSLYIEVARNGRLAPPLWMLYLLGGLGGAAGFWLEASGRGWLTGASASILAVYGCLLALFGSCRVRFMFFGVVKLLWPTLLAIILLLLAENAPATLAAHTGGLIAGVALSLVWRRRTNSAAASVDPTSVNPASADEKEYLDQLLDKIRRSGYNSLSPSERTDLFNISKRLSPSARSRKHNL